MASSAGGGGVASSSDHEMGNEVCTLRAEETGAFHGESPSGTSVYMERHAAAATHTARDAVSPLDTERRESTPSPAHTGRRDGPSILSETPRLFFFPHPLM